MLMSTPSASIRLAPRNRGSSHGSCRVFRRFNFESENYTDLSDAAYAGWKRLEVASGETVRFLVRCSKPGSRGLPLVAASRAAAIAKKLPDPVRSAEDINREFPAFALPADWDVVVQDGGAILKSDVAMRVMRARAGERVIPEAARFEERPDGVLVRTKTQQVLAQRVVLALGPWLGRALPEIASALEVTRQAVGWFKPARPETVLPGQFPIFILQRSIHETVYGFPDFENRGVKAGRHDHGPEVGADDSDPPATDAELLTTGTALSRYHPGRRGSYRRARHLPLHQHEAGRPPARRWRGIHYRSMARFPACRRLGLLGSRCQVCTGDWRHARAPRDRSNLRGRTFFPAIAVFGVCLNALWRGERGQCWEAAVFEIAALRSDAVTVHLTIRSICVGRVLLARRSTRDGGLKEPALRELSSRCGEH